MSAFPKNNLRGKITFIMNLKIKITLEKKRLLRLRRYVKTQIWCEECGMETDFVDENELGEILDLEAKLHKILTNEGTTLICIESISNK